MTLGNLAVGGDRVDHRGQGCREDREHRADVEAAQARQLLHLVRSERIAQRLRIDLLVGAGRDPGADRVAEARLARTGSPGPGGGHRHRRARRWRPRCSPRPRRPSLRASCRSRPSPYHAECAEAPEWHRDARRAAQAQAGSIVPRNASAGASGRDGAEPARAPGVTRRPAPPGEEPRRDDPDRLGVAGREGRAVEPGRPRAGPRTSRRTRPGRAGLAERGLGLDSPTEKSSSGWPSATIRRGLARRLRTLTASGFDHTSSASPSHQNHVGTRCGMPSGRTVESHTTGSAASIGRTRSSVRRARRRSPADLGAR